VRERQDGDRLPWKQEDTPSTKSKEEQVHFVQSARLRYLVTELEGPKGKQIVFAMLDKGSTISIMNEELRRSLGVHGPRKSLRIKTVNGEKEMSEAQLVGVKIRGQFTESKTYSMRYVKAVKELNLEPVNLDFESLKKRYPYLSNVLLKSFRNMKPRMLIGSYHSIIL